MSQVLAEQTKTTSSTPAQPADPETCPDVVGEFGNLDMVEGALKSVQDDLEEEPQCNLEAEENLRDIVLTCYSVVQDLRHGAEILKYWETQPEVEARRYPLRRRTSHVESYDAGWDAPKRRVSVTQRTAKETKRKRPARAMKVETASPADPCTSRANQTTVSNENGSDMETDEVSDLDHPGQGECSQHQDDAQMHDTDNPQTSYRIKKPTVSIQDVIASFRGWKKKGKQTANCLAASLPPLTADLVPETVQPRAMQMDIGWQPERKSLEDPSATKVYVMPSGYIVQSVQLVLEKTQAAKGMEKPPFLKPMFHPAAFTCKTHHLENYIPLWQPQSIASPEFHFVQTDIQMKMVLASPRTEPLTGSFLSGDIDVGSFLAKMDAKWSGCCLPLQTTDPSAQEDLERRVHDLMRHLASGASEEGAPSAHDRSASSPSFDIEKLLQDFSQRLEKFYEE